MTNEEVNKTIADAINQLNQSPRGMRLLVEVVKFTDGEFMGADQFNKRAIVNLIALAGAGYRMRMLDAMEVDA